MKAVRLSNHKRQHQHLYLLPHQLQVFYHHYLLLHLSTSNTSYSLLEKSQKNTSPRSTLRNKSIGITNFLDIINRTELDELNFLLGQFVYGCNLALRIVEYSRFQNFIQKLRPVYIKHIPNRREISTNILDKAHNECISSSMHHLKEESVIIIDE